MKCKKIVMLLTTMMLSVSLFGCGKITADSIIKDLNANRLESFSEDYAKLTEESEQVKVGEKVGEKIFQIIETFVTSKRTDEDLSKAQKDLELLGNGTEFNQLTTATSNTIKEVYDSTVAFNEGMKLFNEKKYEEALASFEKVTESDAINLKEAKVKIEEIKKEIVTPVGVGTSVSQGGFDITFNTFEFSYDVLPKVTSGYYTHYEAKKGQVYYHVALDLKNNNKQNIGGDDILKAELVFNNDYKYSGFAVLDKVDQSGFDYSSITSIKPLETRGIRLLFELPEELESSQESVVINITVDGKTFSYKAR